MQVTITGVNIEVVKPGKSGYSKAAVSYTYKGEPRTQNIMSFANPAVFKQVAEWELALPDGPVDVTLTKNAKGYNEWSAVGEGGYSAQAPSGPSSAAPRPVSSGSNFPTTDERAKTQVYIVKQSSIGHAINILEKSGAPITVDAVTGTAQQLVDYVMGNDNA